MLGNYGAMIWGHPCLTHHPWRERVKPMDDMVGGGKVIKAEVPLAEMFGYATNLRSLTQGRATYTMEFKHYSEAPKNVADEIIAARGK